MVTDSHRQKEKWELLNSEAKLYNSFWAKQYFSCEYCNFYNILKLSLSRQVLTHHAFKGGLLALRDGDVHHRVLDLRRPAGVHWAIWQSRYIYYDECLSVCHEKWSLPPGSLLNSWTPHNHPVQLQVSFDGSRLVFHGSMSVLYKFSGV